MCAVCEHHLPFSLKLKIIEIERIYTLSKFQAVPRILVRHNFSCFPLEFNILIPRCRKKNSKVEYLRAHKFYSQNFLTHVESHV